MDISVGAFLKARFQEMKDKNPRFSLRSFARKLEISPGAVTELMQDKRPLSSYYAAKISRCLSLSEDESAFLLSNIEAKARKFSFDKTLREQELELMTGWEHYAILNLMKTADFQSNSRWIAERLALPLSTVERCLETLENLKIIAKKDGQWVRICQSISTSAEIPSKALVDSHQQDLLKAIEVLQKTPPQVRSFSSSTMAINVEKLSSAKQLIKEFRHRLSMLLEEGEKQEVYTLCVQLFPLTELKISTEE
jgi:plasmid maintenance system antidote protein VapI